MKLIKLILFASQANGFSGKFKKDSSTGVLIIAIVILVLLQESFISNFIAPAICYCILKQGFYYPMQCGTVRLLPLLSSCQ